MWQSSTIKGLDEALAELQRAIEGLPDTSVKKKLRDRYQRLKGVRDGLETSSQPIWNPFPFIGILTIAVLLIYVILHFATRER
ncbi:hypothetical protein AUK22_08565 [bacterium CG2_30_54_10]|nr:MAG: hypothetical protein AUK22_08565 [bacterium CG2_30_54_10]